MAKGACSSLRIEGHLGRAEATTQTCAAAGSPLPQVGVPQGGLWQETPALLRQRLRQAYYHRLKTRAVPGVKSRDPGSAFCLH
eukprot:3234543-Prymnesium_polylepis.3